MQRVEWSLGGPGRFARAVTDDLREGRSVTVVLPSKGVPEGLRRAVRSGLPEPDVNFLDVPSLALPSRPVVESLFDVLGLKRGTQERVRVDGFSSHPDLGRRLIWVDCRQASPAQAAAWGTFLRHYAAAAAAVPAYSRTSFSTICTGPQAAAMPDTDRLVSKRWWWRVLTPLDTALYVSELLDGDARLPGFSEVVTEVAGFDLGVAAMMVEAWDGEPDNLGSLLAAYDGKLHSLGPVSAEGPSPDSRPSPELVEAWSDGLVNAWGDRDPLLHPCQICAHYPEFLRHLIWRGQVRSLMPRIEIERQQLAEWVYDRRDRLPPSWAGQDIMGFEVGGLSKLFGAAPELVRRDRHMLDRANWLRLARNKIAHLEILDRGELERARQIFHDPIGAAR